MQPLSHNPAATAIGTGIVNEGNDGLAGTAAAAPAITGIAPAGADEVSAQAAAAFATDGAETLAVINSAYEELIRAGATVTDITNIYSAVDSGAAHTIA